MQDNDNSGNSSDSLKVYDGVVCWFQKGIGFINWSIDGVAQKDMFVHYSDIACDGFKMLYKDQRVQFSIGVNKHNAPKAVNVLVLKH